MLKERNIWKGFALICVVGASGFFLGAWMESLPLEGEDSLVTRRAPEWRKELGGDIASQMSAVSFWGGKGSKTSQVLSRLLAGAIPANWEEELQILLQDEVPSGQPSAVRIFFCKWAETDFQAAFDRACRLGPLSWNVKKELFIQLAGKDPEKALFCYEQNQEALKRERSKILEVIAKNWAMKSPSRAWDWICSAEFFPYDKEGIVTEFIKGTGFDLEYINRLSEGDGLAMRSVLIEKWALENHEAAWEWLNSQKEARDLNSLKTKALTIIAKTDLVKAEGLLTTMPEKWKPDAIGEIARTMEDKNKALDWVLKRVSPEKVAGSELVFVHYWARENPQEAKDWIRGIPYPRVKDLAIEQFCQWSYSPEQYEENMPLIKEISDVQLRDKIWKDCFDSWQREHYKKEFGDWIQANPDSEVAKLAREKGYIK